MQHFDNLDKGSIRAIMLARGICQEHGFPEVDSDQLLIGLMEENGDAARLLYAAGVKGDELRERILKSIGAGGRQPGLDVPLSKKVQAILSHAEFLAQSLDSEKIGTVHILKALINQKPLGLALMLSAWGITLELVSNLLEKELNWDSMMRDIAEADDTVKPSIIPSTSSKPKFGKTQSESGKEAPPKRGKQAEQISKEERERLKKRLISEEVQEILGLATEQAIQSDSDCVGTEHVLIALFLKEGTIAFKTLRRLGISLEYVESQIAKFGGTTSRKRKKLEDIEFSAQVNSALIFANLEARNSDSYKIESEYLLIGIAQEKEGLAAKILSQASGDDPILDINIRRAVNNSRDAVAADRLNNRREPLILSDRQYMKAAAEPDVTPTTLKGMSADTKKVLTDSAYEAVTYGDTTIGDEHILLGLLSQQGGLSKSIFDSVCLELNMVRNKSWNVERKPYSITWTGLPSSWNITIPLSKDTKKLIMRGRALARNSRSGQLKPEHLLLAILEREDGRAIKTLRAADVNIEHLKKLVLDAMEQKSGK
jgi:ATPases with chaperone activity, ATP-binding subunit